MVFHIVLGNSSRRRARSENMRRAKKKRKLSISKYRILVETVDLERNKWFKVDLDPTKMMLFNPYAASRRRIKYNRHDHVNDPIHYNSIAASQVLTSEKETSFTPAATIGGRIYSIKNDKIVFNDIDSAEQAWEPLPSSPCISPLIRGCHPTLTSHKGRLYILGCNDGGDLPDSSQFGCVFDPQCDKWVVIARPNANNFRRSFLAASIFDSLLLIDRNPWIFDEFGKRRSQPYFLTDCEEWIPFKYTRALRSHFPDINNSGKLAAVHEESTIYWISNSGHIYAYNLETSETQCGPVLGLEYTDFLESLLEGEIEVPLFHLEGDLFCLLYQDSASRYQPSSELHCLIARLVKCESFVFMIVVGCFCAPISGICNFRNSFLTCGEE